MSDCDRCRNIKICKFIKPKDICAFVNPVFSNADRIRAMNDEELFDFINSDQCCMMSETWGYKDIIEWLQSEVKESEEE